MTRDRARVAFSHPGIAGAAVALVLCAGGCGVDDASSANSGRPLTTAPPAGAGGGLGGASGGVGGQTFAGVGGQTGFMPQGGSAGAAATAGAGGGAGWGQAGAPQAGAGGTGAAGMMTAAGAGGASGSPAPSGEICEQWKAARANLTEDMWNGNVANCEAGSMSEEDLAVAHGLHSLYRTMAGLSPVEMTAEGNRLAQECALLMQANTRISHEPPMSWTCWNMERADTAARSSLSGEGAIASVHAYMVDPGNETTLGHRRWILSNTLASIGFGSTGRFSCQYQPPVFRGGSGGKPWIAWPPPGQIPIQAFSTRFANMDSTGWSVQSDTIDLSGAQVAVTSGGMDRPVSVTQLQSGYGSRYAIRFNPVGWSTAAGTTYSVKIGGTSTPIEYEVEVVDCP